jgi:hypothetical protein
MTEYSNTRTLHEKIELFTRMGHHDHAFIINLVGFSIKDLLKCFVCLLKHVRLEIRS